MIGFKIAVELPDCGANGGLGGTVLVREGVELVDEAFGVNLIQSSG
jgi:hypothetical protein